MCQNWYLINPLRTMLWIEVKNINLYVKFQYRRLNKKWRLIEIFLGHGVLPIYDAYITFDKCVKHIIYNRQFKGHRHLRYSRRELVNEFPFYTFYFPIECV